MTARGSEFWWIEAGINMVENSLEPLPRFIRHPPHRLVAGQYCTIPVRPARSMTSWSRFPPPMREIQFDEQWAFVAKNAADCDPKDWRHQEAITSAGRYGHCGFGMNALRDGHAVRRWRRAWPITSRDDGGVVHDAGGATLLGHERGLEFDRNRRLRVGSL